MKKGEIYEGVVERIDFPNKGRVHVEGETVTVKNAIPGQKIRFQINKKRKNRMEGRLLEVTEKSPMEKRDPVCSIFPSCGGCMYQTMSYEDQLAKYVERIIVMNHGHVAFDDTPKKVFAHYKELEKIGLAAPQMTYIMHALKEHGMDVDVTATTVEEARDTILAALESQKKNGKKGAEVC